MQEEKRFRYCPCLCDEAWFRVTTVWGIPVNSFKAQSAYSPLTCTRQTIVYLLDGHGFDDLHLLDEGFS